jgi:rhodanese-related sulfurtransferase
MFAALFCGCGNSKNNESVKTVNVEEFAEKMAQQDVRFIDVRTPKEYAEGHLQGARNVVWGDDFEKQWKAAGIKKQFTVAVYCRGGRRSKAAAKELVKMGYKVIDLDGGIMAWQKAGKPIVK